MWGGGGGGGGGGGVGDHMLKDFNTLYLTRIRTYENCLSMLGQNLGGKGASNKFNKIKNKNNLFSIQYKQLLSYANIKTQFTRRFCCHLISAVVTFVTFERLDTQVCA